MAREILQSRTFFDQLAVGNLVTQFAVDPDNLPDGSTLTRLIGHVSVNIWADQIPQFGVSVVAGFIVKQFDEPVDPLVPDATFNPWSWWRFDTVWPGLTDGSQTARWEFDVRGQRIISQSTTERLFFVFRGQDFAASETVLLTTSLVGFYKLPAVTP